MKPLLALALFLATTSAPAQLGTISFPNSGKPEAQAAFLRGVAALHSFWYDEAAAAFREAEGIDPSFALAYWGEAMTFNHPIWMEVDVEGGRKALAKLGATGATPRERAWLDAVQTLYSDGAKTERDDAYEKAMETLARKDPDDVEAQIFWALSILGTHKPADTDVRKQIAAAAILEPIFATHPDHPGALHYLIHAYDDPLHAPLGLRAAKRYARVAPAAFHALHMPSHIFLQLGMWPETIASNEQSYATSKQWVESRSLPRSKRDLHSLQWLQYAYLQQSRFDDARKLFDEAGGDDVRERTARMNMQARFAIETGDWSVLPEALPAKNEMPEHTGCGPKYDVSGLVFAIGMRAVAQGKRELASESLKRLKSGSDVATVMSKELEAVMEPNTAKALPIAAEAVALEDRLGPPSGPPDTIKPAHELYGELLLRTGRKAEAGEQFRQALLRTPNRRLSLIGAGQATPPVPLITAEFLIPSAME